MQYFGVYIGVPLFRETTIYIYIYIYICIWLLLLSQQTDEPVMNQELRVQSSEPLPKHAVVISGHVSLLSLHEEARRSAETERSFRVWGLGFEGFSKSGAPSLRKGLFFFRMCRGPCFRKSQISKVDTQRPRDFSLGSYRSRCNQTDYRLGRYIPKHSLVHNNTDNNNRL